MNPMSNSRAARLVAISKEASAQSEVAIQNSLRLLRQPTYPEDRSERRPDRRSEKMAAPVEP